MAAECITTITEQWIRDRLQLTHPRLDDVRSISLPGTHQEKIGHLGNALKKFVRLKSLDLSYNALFSIEGVQHLTVLERLILYHNCIPSIEEVKVLYHLPVLRELDLRLNPLAKSNPHYRLHLVHAMPSLRKLDSCAVRDTERKVAVMQFSSDLVPQKKKSSSLNENAEKKGGRNQRVVSVESMAKRLSIRNDTDDMVLNFLAKNPGALSETQGLSGSARAEEEEHKYFTEQRSSTPRKETYGYILSNCATEYDNTESKGSHKREPSHKSSSTSLKESERTKVSFEPRGEQCRHVSGKQKDPPRKTRQEAKGNYTPNPDQSRRHSAAFFNVRPPSPPSSNLCDPSNPILHPPRLTYSSFNKTETGPPQQGEKHRRGSYRKPLEMLLDLVDKHWTTEKSLHHNNNFLSQAVQILSMMEKHVSCREAEVRALRRDAEAQRFQQATREEEHRAEADDLYARLDEARLIVGKANEQLRIVLEENVALQKQLVKLERKYLKSMMKSSPVAQMKEAQMEVEELRTEIEGLRVKVQEAERVKELSNMLQESHRSLVATNQCLIAELKGSGYH